MRPQSHLKKMNNTRLAIDVIIPLREVSTSQRQNTPHSQHQTYHQPRYPTKKDYIA